MHLENGTEIAGLYRVDRRIGVGGMGEVWAGVRLSDDADVALKVLLSHTTDVNEVLARFRREAQVLALIDSEYVARVYDFLAAEDGFVLVMELIPGESLHAVLYQSALSVEETLDIASDVLHGLRDLHNGNVVHRDLKPGNIVLRPRPGRSPRATLIDFGVSRIMSGDDDDEEVTAITRGDRVLGTLEYMAPEQILGSRTVTGTADLYALGAIMFRAITGHHVFGDLQEGHLAVAKLNNDAPRLDITRTDEVAERTQGLVARLLSRRVRERFANADEVISEVEVIRAMITQGTLNDSVTSGVASMPQGFPAEPEISSPFVEVRAAIPIEVPGAPSDTSGRKANAAVPSSSNPYVHSQTNLHHPSSARVRDVRRESSSRTLLIAITLFVFGSVGGGLFGVSFARGGLAYQMVFAGVKRIHGTTGGGEMDMPQPPSSQPVDTELVVDAGLDAALEAESSTDSSGTIDAVDVGADAVNSKEAQEQGKDDEPRGDDAGSPKTTSSVASVPRPAPMVPKSRPKPVSRPQPSDDRPTPLFLLPEEP